MAEPIPLPARERDLLIFEREWWKHADAKDAAIREHLDLSPEDYYQALNAIIDTDVFVENAKSFGTYCGKNPSVSIVTAADEVLGK